MCQGESKAEQQELTEIRGDPANNDCSLIVRNTADLLRVKGLVICFYLGWYGSILQIRTNIIKVGSKSLMVTYL